MKDVVLGTACLLVGVVIGYFGSTKTVTIEVEKEKVVEKIVELQGTPVTVKSVDNVEDLRLSKENAVNAVITFDKEVPNGYGLLVVDLKDGTWIKMKMTDNHGPGFKWGGPVTKLHSKWTPKLNSEPAALVGCTARFYSSDFPPEVLSKMSK